LKIPTETNPCIQLQELDKKIAAVYQKLVEAQIIKPKPEPSEPQIPMDFAAAQVTPENLSIFY
jgi:hypothetical protein